MNPSKNGWFAKTPSFLAAKRVVVAVIGGTVVLIGIALIVLPGPAFIVLPIGLSILATEFVWAKHLNDPSPVVRAWTMRLWSDQVLLPWPTL